MHQIGVVGVSYRHAGVDDVARFALPKTDVAARLPALRESLRAAEVLYLGTCYSRRQSRGRFPKRRLPRADRTRPEAR
jgi:hypothetical protein